MFGPILDAVTAVAVAFPPPLVEHPVAILAILLAVLAIIFQLASHPATRGFFRVVPSLIFCYFVPTTLTTLGVIPDSSELYSWVKSYLLPASLLLLILALDLPGIIRLGPKAIIMMLTGTAGVVIGAPIAFAITKTFLPEDAWRGLSALSGSWIGGGANFVAIGTLAEASEQMISLMVVPDVLIANIWMGVLLFLSGRQKSIDARTGANAQAIRDLEVRMTEFQERVNRIPSLADLMTIVALGIGGSWLAHLASVGMPVIKGAEGETIISSKAWIYILVTTAGILLSFTSARNLEGAGASKVGSVFLYLLVACIGAHADFRDVAGNWAYLGTAAIWMVIHVALLLTVGYLIRAPIFFVAIGSQANIGGAASAPVVAAAFHPSLAPVGVLLAILGYAMGTYAGIVCMNLLKWVADAP